MSVTDLPLRLAHLSSLRCGHLLYRSDLLRDVVDRVNASRPDVVLVAGDLTASGYAWEYEEAVGWLDRLEAPQVVVAGNHDSRNVGYLHFERHFGERFVRYRQELDEVRAERLDAPGITVLGLDTSEPDLDEGRVGREWYDWIRKGYDHPDDLKVFLVHHHLVAIPGAGREQSVIEDAGDVLAILTEVGVDIAVSGHKHVPYFWGVNGMLVANGGTASTRLVRGTVEPSWNEFVIDASTNKVFVHYPDGSRELAVIRNRGTLALVRESFLLTDDFFASNHLPVG